MPIYRGFGAIVAAVIALAMGVVPTTAGADAVTAPQVSVRLVDPDNATVGVTPWQPLSATLSSMGPYDLGVALQSTAAEYNRQAVEIDIVSGPGGPVPGLWSTTFDPYAPYCETLAGTPGTIQPTGAQLYFHGNGTYVLNVSMYTDAQHSAFPGNTCSGGPTSTVSLTVNAAPTVRIAGVPLAPRTTRQAHGDNGPVLSLPVGNQGYKWRCARDPVVGADGSVTGTATTSASDTGAGSGSDPIPVQETRCLHRARTVGVLGPGPERRQRRQRIRHVVGDDPHGNGEGRVRPRPDADRAEAPHPRPDAADYSCHQDRRGGVRPRKGHGHDQPRDVRFGP